MRPCLDVDLFMTYRCDLFFSFTLIIINQIISLKQTHLFFAIFFQNTPYYYTLKESKRKKRMQIFFQKQKFSLRVLLSFCLIFFANFSLVLLIKKACTAYRKCWKTPCQLVFQIINTIIYSSFSNRYVWSWYSFQSIPQTYQREHTNEA